ncbi:MAG TPA: PIN domain-containing protein [Mucilaginibacter sp.]|jgi:hypothetical protein
MAKEKIICDTDVLIDLFDQAQSRDADTHIILEQKIGFENILISSVTKMELLLGAKSKADLLTIQKKLNRFSIVLINPSINLKAINLIESYRLSHGLALADALIAAIAIETEVKLFTYNTRDFKFITHLTLYKG